MATKKPDIIERGEIPDGQIDKGEPIVKNKFRWVWLDSKDINGDFFSDFIRKLKTNGEAWCILCNRVISYGSSGFKALRLHAACKKHIKVRNSLKTSQALPVLYQTVNKLNSCSGEPQTASVQTVSSSSNSVYGQLPNVPAASTSNANCDAPQHVESKLVNLKDRVAHQEALVISFLAEHNIPFSVAPHIVALAMELGRDSEALAEVKLCRKTVSYKLTQGLALVLHNRLVESMRNVPFSLTIDETTTRGNKERVLNILVSLCGQEDEHISTVYHYASIISTTFNSEFIFNAVTEQLSKDEIPLSNVISCLIDSSSRMAGYKTGCLKRLMDVCPNMLDIDNDVCHHVHNCVKMFCSNFGNTMEKLFDDLHTDFDSDSDLGSYLKEICRLLGFKFYKPNKRIPHSGLSVLDCAVEFRAMQVPLTVFYFAFLKAQDKMLYNPVVLHILRPVSTEKRQRIFQILRTLKLKYKSLSTAGRERKHRIVQNLFSSSHQTQSLLDLYISILPLFKSFLLCFESSEPKIHLLYDEQEDLVRQFLSCFMKPEYFAKLPDAQLLELDLLNQECILPWKQVFCTSSEDIQHSEEFVKKVIAAYQRTGCYIQKKFPLNNKVFKDLSAIDPRAFGHSETMTCLNNLIDRMPTLLSGEEKVRCKAQVRLLQIENNLPPFEKTDTIDKWWASFFSTHDWPQLQKLIQACLSIFSGPRVEGSSSLMDNIITPQTKRLNTQTYSAIQSVKYFLATKGKSSLEYYHREDVLTSPIDKPLVRRMQTARPVNKIRSTVAAQTKQQYKLPASAAKPNNHHLANKIKTRLLARAPAKRKAVLGTPRPAKKRKVCPV